MSNLFIGVTSENSYNEFEINDFSSIENININQIEKLDLVLKTNEEQISKNIFNTENINSFSELQINRGNEKEIDLESFNLIDLDKLNGKELINHYFNKQIEDYTSDYKSELLNEHFSDSWGGVKESKKIKKELENVIELKEKSLGNRDVTQEEFKVLKENIDIKTNNEFRKELHYNSPLKYEENELENKLKTQIKQNKLLEQENKTNNSVDRLKSVELEKNVINLLPKQEQELNFTETLSRLEKNKTSLVEDLKEYLNSKKIEEIITSVRSNFNNIKVKAEDVYNTFKDLGNWNTDNKFVENIDNVINKVKNLSHSNVENYDINDPKFLEKLDEKLRDSNNFIDTVQKNNLQNDKLEGIRMSYIENTLNTLEQLDNNSIEDLKSEVSNMSDEKKLEVYQYSKNLISFTEDSNNINDMKSEYLSKKLAEHIENDVGKEKINDLRHDYLISNQPKPFSLKTQNNNTPLSQYLNSGNELINKADHSSLRNMEKNLNKELKNINDNNKANELLNNDLVKKYNHINNEKRETSIEENHNLDTENMKQRKNRLQR
ncbi:hypothetical protein ACEE94_10565 [Staphylococcus epidermidis]